MFVEVTVNEAKAPGKYQKPIAAFETVQFKISIVAATVSAERNRNPYAFVLELP